MKILKIKDVIAQTGLSRSQLYKMASRGLFPRQIKLSARSSGWLESEVNQWLNARIAERDCAPSKNEEAAK
ncbi:helix-turn-helix transcriptional regulator [methane-oxidizing endosymbiont of Gigantopelta aegis]|uniref:helix-turn-helix transcriptional regulator n=1 Tax=methane-oxidizing endosymbiont of Gigantopelta aegis TaxID=2794938 RepID=UPI0018DBE8BB|nr:AlpA family transcriptional regulator [methane-oxidizing endosymbiont of Gigantopelta aegis]